MEPVRTKVRLGNKLFRVGDYIGYTSTKQFIGGTPVSASGYIRKLSSSGKHAYIQNSEFCIGSYDPLIDDKYLERRAITSLKCYLNTDEILQDACDEIDRLNKEVADLKKEKRKLEYDNSEYS